MISLNPTDPQITRNFIQVIIFTFIFLPSTFIGSAPLSVLGALLTPFFLYKISKKEIHFIFLILLCFAINFILRNHGISSFEFLKTCVGAMSFLFILLFLPNQINENNTLYVKTVYYLYIFSILTFYIEIFLGVGLYDLGLIKQWSGLDNQIYVRRISGPFIEPSWFALALSAMYYFLQKNGINSLLMYIFYASSILLVNSSIGLIFLLFLSLNFLLMKRAGAHFGINLLLVSFALLFVIYFFQKSGVFEETFLKIINPTDYASGIARFLLPLPYLSFVASENMFSGMGMSYSSEFLIGLTGLAVLPFTVFIELGILGLVLYGVLCARTMFYYRPSILSLILLVVLMFSIGMHANPFTAALIILLILPKPQRLSYSE